MKDSQRRAMFAKQNKPKSIHLPKRIHQPYDRLHATPTHILLIALKKTQSDRIIDKDDFASYSNLSIEKELQRRKIS